MSKYIIANWKCNKNTTEVTNWAIEFKKKFELHQLKLNIVVCPSFLHLPLLRSTLSGISFGAQTLSPYPNGSYTGQVSALQASEFVQYAILGHTERRKYFGETNQSVTNEAVQALENAITPIISVDKSNWSSQLSQLSASQLQKVLVMYEPPEAISTSVGGGHAAEVGEVRDVIHLIKSEYSVLGCLYGGSIDDKNVETYMKIPGVDGAVVGAASLDPDVFFTILQKTEIV